MEIPGTGEKRKSYIHVCLFHEGVTKEKAFAETNLPGRRMWAKQLGAPCEACEGTKQSKARQLGTTRTRRRQPQCNDKNFDDGEDWPWLFKHWIICTFLLADKLGPTFTRLCALSSMIRKKIKSWREIRRRPRTISTFQVAVDLGLSIIDGLGRGDCPLLRREDLLSSFFWLFGYATIRRISRRKR